MPRWGQGPPTPSLADRVASSTGVVSGKGDFLRFAYDGDVDGTERVLWPGGSSIAYAFATTPETIRIRSGGNAADTAAGAGAREITVTCMDADGALTDVTIATNGTSASSATANSVLRVERVWVSAGGTYTADGLDGGNVGQIVIEGVSTGDAYAIISAGEGQTEQSIYTVPAGWNAHLTGVMAEVDGSASARCSFAMYQRRAVGTTSAPVEARRIVNRWPGVLSIPPTPLDGSPWFPPLTDIWVTASKDGGGAAVAATFRYGLAFRRASE